MDLVLPCFTFLTGVGKNIYRPGPAEVVIDISKDTTQ